MLSRRNPEGCVLFCSSPVPHVITYKNCNTRRPPEIPGGRRGKGGRRREKEEEGREGGKEGEENPVLGVGIVGLDTTPPHIRA
jgi:hypothetical protein